MKLVFYTENTRTTIESYPPRFPIGTSRRLKDIKHLFSRHTMPTSYGSQLSGNRIIKKETTVVVPYVRVQYLKRYPLTPAEAAEWTDQGHLRSSMSL